MALRDGLHACKHSSRVSVPPPASRELGTTETSAAAPSTRPLPALIPIEELLARSGDDGSAALEAGDTAAALLRVARWSRDFLTNPHPALGRPGHVCPYVSSAIRERRFLLTVIHDTAAATLDAEHTMLQLCEYFLHMAPTSSRQAHRKTIVALLADLPPEQTSEVINSLHRRLKPHFLRRGLMLGEFYADSEKRGLHNPHFRPLRSDTPLLVIRAMVLTDIAFLSDDAAFVRPFLDTFGDRGCEEVLAHVERAREQLTQAQITMLLEQVEAARAVESMVRPTDSPPRA